MRIALFSDIHANLPALESCFKSIDKKNVDAVYCLGDLVGYNIWPNEVINEIRKRHIPTITGNYDFGIGRSSNDCGCAYKTDIEKSNGSISITYTNEIVKDEERRYLRTLPSHIRLEIGSGDHKLNLLLVHGSPRRINEYLFEDRDEKSLLRIMHDANADIMCFGHTHKPYHRTISDPGNNSFGVRHAINIGSVGKPKDGDLRGCYVIVEINDIKDTQSFESLKLEFIRFNYDIETAANAIKDSRFPNDYAESLRKGT